MMRAFLSPRLLLLAAALFALAALLAPGAQPAQAQSAETTWSTTLTVDVISDRSGCADVPSAGGQLTACSTGMSDDNFVYEGVSYRIRQLYYFDVGNNRNLNVSFDKAIAPNSRLRQHLLRIDGRIYSLASGTWTGGNQVRLFKTGLPTWTDGQRVSVRLLDPPPGHIWSSTLTVGDGGTLRGYNRAATVGTLSDENFTYGGVDYQVDRASVTAGIFILEFNKAIPDSLKSTATLHVGNRQFPLANGTINQNGTGIYWSNTGLSWSVGQQVQLSLTEPPPPSKLTLRTRGTLREGGGPVTVTYTLDQPAKCDMSTSNYFGGTASTRIVQNDYYLESVDLLEEYIEWFNEQNDPAESKEPDIAGVDVFISRQPDIDRGETTASQRIIVFDDDVVDHGESFVLGATMFGLGDCDASVPGEDINFAIRDNERKNGRSDPSTGRAGSASPTRLTLSADKTTVREGEDSEILVNATLDKPALSTMSVMVAFSGTATRNPNNTSEGGYAREGDYDVYSGSAQEYRILINGGETTGIAPMVIFLYDDGEVERTENITLTATVDKPKLTRTLRLSIRDNDRAGVTVSQTALTAAPGDYVYYTVKLNSSPTADVTITPTSSNTGRVTVSPATLTFTAANWKREQRVTVTRVAPGSATITQRATSDDSNYRRSVSSVRVTDPPAADPTGVTLSHAGPVAEDVGTVTLTARVDAPTLSAVTVTVTVETFLCSAATIRCAVNTIDYTGLPTTITIARGQYEGTATIAIIDDTSAEPDETIIIKGRTSPELTVWSRALVIKTNDGCNNCATGVEDEVVRTYTVSPQSRAVEGQDAGLTLTLIEAAPAGGVEFTVAANPGTAGTGDVGAIASPVTVPEGDTTLVVAIPTADDAVDEDDESFTVTVTAVTLGWLAEAGEDTATVTIEDDDTAGVTVNAANPLEVDEDGSATYTVVLDSRPTHDVTIDAVSGDADAATVFPASFTIAPENWNVPESFLVSGASDADTNDETVGISHRITSQDGKYAAAPVGSVSVAVTDTTQPQEQNQEQSPSGKYASLIAQMYEWRNDPDWVDYKSHTDRWDRALLAFGETVADASLTAMPASEAQGYADQAWGTRWVPVAAAMWELENQAPTVSAALGDVTVINQDASGARTVSLSGVFSDADGDELTITAASSDETVSLAGVSDDQTGVLILGNTRGTATVTVTADDGKGGTVADTFTVTVKAAPVVASAISDLTGLGSGSTQEVSLSGVFSDADGDSLTISASSSDDAKATVTVASDGSELTVAGVAEGTATITVTAQDTDGNRVSDTFDVAVTAGQQQQQDPPPNQSPTVSSALVDATIVNESGTKEVSHSGVFDDPDGDDLTITAGSSDDDIATVSVSADYSTLTVSAKARGTATINVTAADSNGGTVSDTFTVTVKTAPVVASAIADVTGLEEGASQDISLSGMFSDADGDSLTITAVSSDDALVGAFVFHNTLTIAAFAEGTETITVTAQDADGNSVSDTFEVSVVKKYAALIAQMYQWRNDPQWVDNKEHTDRWDRALLALGETVADATLTPMTGDEAQELADRGWQRWEPVAKALKEVEGG